MEIELRGIDKSFGQVVALDSVDLTIGAGEFVCFLGPSGCGKTTLLRILAGLETADRGRILMRGQDITDMPARRRNLGMVFQSYSLFPHMTVARNVAYGLQCRGFGAAEIGPRVEEMLALVDLSDQAHKYPSQLSGGQQQRVALARALAPNPSALLLDEPLSALDAKVRDTLRSEIRDLQKELGVTTVMVTHDQEEAMEMADRIVVMNRGRVVQVGTADDLYYRPADRFVAEFIGRINLVKPRTHNGPPLGVRPEDVELIADPQVPLSDCLNAVVRKVTFLGTVQRVAVDCEGQRLQVDVPGRSERLEVGQWVRLRLPADAFPLPEEVAQ